MFEVTHEKLYMMVNGKTTHVPKGTQLEISPNAAARLVQRGKIKEVAKDSPVKLGSKGAGNTTK